MELAAIIAVIAIALVFDYTNGFHDAANAIATSVSTRALTPRVALLMAAVMNFVGAFLGTKVAKTVGHACIEPPTGEHALVVVFAALVGAITWNLITWYFGLPSSSSHALIGGLVGAALAGGGHRALGRRAWRRSSIPMFLSPLVGVVLALPAHGRRSCGSSGTSSRGRSTAASGSPRPSRPQRWRSATACRTRRRRWASSCSPWSSAATRTATSTSPGGSWCSRPARSRSAPTPAAGGSCAPSGRRIIDLDPPRGFAAETVGGLACSTRRRTSSRRRSRPPRPSPASIMGAGATRGRRAVRWGVAGNILVAWVLTIPWPALVAAVTYDVVHLFLE